MMITILMALMVIGLIAYIALHRMRDYQQAVQSSLIAAIYSIGNGAHAVAVREKAEEITGKSISIGTLYVALGNLEQQGKIRSWQEPGGSERDYRNRRCYAINTDFRMKVQVSK